MLAALQKAPTLSKPKNKPRPQKAHGPFYKVFLHNHQGRLSDKEERRYVVGCVLSTFEDMESKEAIRKVYMAHKVGTSLMRIYPQYKAEESCEKLRRNAIASTIEPMDL